MRIVLCDRNEPMEFGCTQLLIPPDVVRDLVRQDAVNISPGGVVFVKPLIRKGVLPQMLSEILDTRIMVSVSFWMICRNRGAYLVEFLALRRPCEHLRN